MGHIIVTMKLRGRASPATVQHGCVVGAIKDGNQLWGCLLTPLEDFG